MKKLILFLNFIIGMMMNAQVVQNQVFSTTEEISFVSDNGGGTYTVSGPGAGDDGFLAIYDENNSSWEYKDFPPRTDLGSVHNADVDFSYTLNSGTTIAYGTVANSGSTSWQAIRRYENGGNVFSQEEITQAGIKIFPPLDENLYARVFVGSNGGAWGLNPGYYLVKINSQNLSSPDWVYSISGGYDIEVDDNLISTAKIYRCAIQQLPNGNIAVTVVRLLSGQTPDREYQLWEFDPATGQKLGVIDDSNTDYDRDGNYELQYRFHRWKVVNGVLYHEFWQDPNNSQDAQIGHWEKLEVPGWNPGGSGHTAGWTSAGLQITAVSDFDIHDSFGYLPKDFWIDSEGKMRFEGVHLSENLALYKVERMYVNISDNMDEWVAPTGERMVMTRHSLIRVTYNEMFTSHIQVAAGNNVTDARNNEVYANGGWESIYGEGTVVVNHSAMPQVGGSTDSSWWTIPSGFHYVGETPIAESHDPMTNGMLYFYVDAIRDGENVDANEMLLRIWIIDANTVSVPEMEVSGLKLYPNPVESFLTVEADDGVDAVRVYNISGIMVKEADGVHSVFVGDLPTGVYIVEVTAGEAVSRRKIVKK